MTNSAPRLALPSRASATLDTVHCCDALALLRALGDNSVDMVFIDPPYNVTMLAFERAIDWPYFWLQARRVLKAKNSPTLIFSQQPFTTDLINSNRASFRYEIVIEKSAPTGFLDANRRPLRCHENLLVFADAMPDYWPVFDKPQVMRADTSSRRKLGVHAQHYGKNEAVSTWYDEGKRYPRDVWHVAQRDTAFKKTSTLNPTQKPLEAIEKALSMYSQPGWVVVDCFAGSGTTAVGCRNLKRHYICCDTDPVMVAIAKDRLRLPFEAKLTAPNNDVSDLPLFEGLAI